MAVYLREFTTQAAYEAAKSSLILPNVSLIDETNGVEYNPSSPEPPSDPRLIAVYNVTDTSNPTALRTSYEQNIFKSMEIDGVMLDELVTEYTFSAVGEHTVKYELYDDTKLGNQAPVFYNSNLVECIIPDSVTSIGNYAFYSCGNLSSLNISGTIENMGYSSFYGCTSLPAENGIIYVQDYLIQVSDATLQAYTIKPTTKVICDSAFEACTNITGITIPDSVTEIRDYAFSGVSTLTDVTIGNGVKNIGMCAFSHCSSISSCTIGNSLEVIYNQAFEFCSGLDEITLPASMKTIGDNVWAYAGLKLTVLATTPPTCGDQIFYSSGCSIYVPSASVDAYKAAEGWNFYEENIQAIQ